MPYMQDNGKSNNQQQIFDNIDLTQSTNVIDPFNINMMVQSRDITIKQKITNSYQPPSDQIVQEQDSIISKNSKTLNQALLSEISDIECYKCNGQGKINSKDIQLLIQCKKCKGQGKLPNSQELIQMQKQIDEELINKYPEIRNKLQDLKSQNQTDINFNSIQTIPQEKQSFLKPNQLLFQLNQTEDNLKKNKLLAERLINPQFKNQNIEQDPFNLQENNFLISGRATITTPHIPCKDDNKSGLSNITGEMPSNLFSNSSSAGLASFSNGSATQSNLQQLTQQKNHSTIQNPMVNNSNEINPTKLVNSAGSEQKEEEKQQQQQQQHNDRSHSLSNPPNLQLQCQSQNNKTNSIEYKTKYLTEPEMPIVGMQAGKEFCPTYQIQNIGVTKWPENCYFYCIAGVFQNSKFKVPSLPPKEDCFVNLNLKVPEKPDKYICSWRMCYIKKSDGEIVQFGSRATMQLIVE